MKLVRKIDEQGYFLEDVLVEDNDTLLEEVSITETVVTGQDEEGNDITEEIQKTEMQKHKDIIEVEVPEGLYKPLWNGTEWVEGLTDADINLDEYKKQKINELDKKCQEKILGTFESSALGTPHLYSYDTEAQSNFGKVEQALKYYPEGVSVEWRIHDTRETLPHTKEQFVQLFLDSITHLQSNIGQFRQIESLIKVATTKQEIDNALNMW